MKRGRWDAESAKGRAVIWSVTALAILFCRSLHAADTYPAYSAQSIVSGATQTVEALAPNSIATIYGTNLSFTTSSTSGTLPGSTLPNTLEGVTVYVNNIAAHLFFVSPGQINFLIPYEITPGTVSIAVARQGAAGPSVKIPLNSTAPDLFAWSGGAGTSATGLSNALNYAIAVHLSGALISPDAPATAGEIIVLYAAGLGRVNPDTTSGRLVTSAAPIVASSQVQVTLAGVPSAASSILYAGLAPGFAGLYQINLRLPDNLPANPEIRITAAGQTSLTPLRLPTRASEPMPAR